MIEWLMNIRSAKVDELAQRLARLTGGKISRRRWNAPLGGACPVSVRRLPIEGAPS